MRNRTLTSVVVSGEALRSVPAQTRLPRFRVCVCRGPVLLGRCDGDEVKPGCSRSLRTDPWYAPCCTHWQRPRPLPRAPVCLTMLQHFSVPTATEDTTATQESSVRRHGLTHPLLNQTAVCEQFKQLLEGEIVFFPLDECRGAWGCRAICKTIA